MPGPTPVPGEQVNIYDGTTVYWDITRPANQPPTLIVKAVNGTKVKINRADGSIIP
jgi:hypothetical protein